jgi:hypothetical protein
VARGLRFVDQRMWRAHDRCRSSSTACTVERECTRRQEEPMQLRSARRVRAGGAVAAGDMARVQLPASFFVPCRLSRTLQEAFALAGSPASRRLRRSRRRLARSRGRRSRGICVGAAPSKILGPVLQNFRGILRSTAHMPVHGQQNHWSIWVLGSWSKAITRDPGNLLPAIAPE